MLVEIQLRVDSSSTSPYISTTINLDLLRQTLTDCHIELAHPSCVGALIADELRKQSCKGDQSTQGKDEAESVRQQAVGNDVFGVGFNLDVVVHVSHLVT